jgi:hypothetical protein
MAEARHAGVRTVIGTTIATAHRDDDASEMKSRECSQATDRQSFRIATAVRLDGKHGAANTTRISGSVAGHPGQGCFFALVVGTWTLPPTASISDRRLSI